jgi:hypothetical protein
MNFNKFTSFEKIFCAFPTFKASASLGLCQIHRVRKHSRFALAAMPLHWVPYRLDGDYFMAACRTVWRFR